ncbi:MAG: uncharacterized protein PWP23_3154 [Candidatus Sumerlaeota bacterium]|nr:uncharacterized protein [Candidatus Sumerlaeota bacterium]
MRPVFLFLLLLVSPAVLFSQPQDPELLNLEARGRAFVQAVVRGRVVTVRSEMSEQLRTALSDEALARILWDFHQQGGNIRDIGAARASLQPKGEVLVLVPIHAAQASALAEVTFQRLAPLAPVTGFTLNRIDPAVIASYREQGLLPRDDDAAAPYVDTSFIKERTVEIPGSLGPLPGVLTLPSTAGKGVPAPAIVLVPGLEAEGIDGRVGKSRIFRDIAQGLATRGVAVLRYNPPTSEWPDAFGEGKLTTLNDVIAADAMAATAFLEAQEDIDGERITLVTMEAASYAAGVLARATRARAVVLLAPAHPVVNNYLRRRLAEQGVANSGELMGLSLLGVAEQHFDHSGYLWMQLRGQNAVADLAAAGKPFALLFPAEDPLFRPKDAEAWQPALAAGGFNAFTRTYQVTDRWFRSATPDGPSRYADEQLIADLAFFAQRSRLQE